MNRRQLNHRAGAKVRKHLNHRPGWRGGTSRSAARHRRLAFQNLRLADGHRQIGNLARRWLEQHPGLRDLIPREVQQEVVQSSRFRELAEQAAVTRLQIAEQQQRERENLRYWELYDRRQRQLGYLIAGEAEEYSTLYRGRHARRLPLDRS